jgi:MFS family permease
MIIIDLLKNFFGDYVLVAFYLLVAIGSLTFGYFLTRIDKKGIRTLLLLTLIITPIALLLPDFFELDYNNSNDTTGFVIHLAISITVLFHWYGGLYIGWHIRQKQIKRSKLEN